MKHPIPEVMIENCDLKQEWPLHKKVPNYQGLQDINIKIYNHKI